MKENNLKVEQGKQIATLLRIIIEQSQLFSKPHSISSLQLVKIPISILERSGLSFAEAKNLIERLNEKFGINDFCMQILNGRLGDNNGEVYTMVLGDTYEKVDGVDIEDDKDFLILWVWNLNKIRQKTEKILKMDILKAPKKFQSDEEKKIRLHINVQRKEIKRVDNEFKHSFLKAMGINKRFEYLIAICKNPQISGNDLRGRATIQNLSKEIKKMNVALRDKLFLGDDLIVNNGGYEINNKFIVEFI